MPKQLAKRAVPQELAPLLFWEALWRVRRPAILDLAGEPLQLYAGASDSAVKVGLSQDPEPGTLAKADLPACAALRAALERWEARWRIPTFCRGLAWDALARLALGLTPSADEGGFVTFPSRWVAIWAGTARDRTLSVPGWNPGAETRAQARKRLVAAVDRHLEGAEAAWRRPRAEGGDGGDTFTPRDLEWLVRRRVPLEPNGEPETALNIGLEAEPPADESTVLHVTNTLAARFTAAGFPLE